MSRSSRDALGLAIALLALGSSGCGAPADRCERAELQPVAGARLAIALSDYSSAAIAILDEDDVLHAPFLDSGSRPPGLVAALSGDVALPRAPLSPGLLVVLDRYQTDVLTGVHVDAPESLFQVDLRGGRTSGSSPNPQDALALRDGRWLVSRYNPAEDASAPELARGNDLAVLDAEDHALTDRIELDGDVTIDGVTYFARPSGLTTMRSSDRELVLVALSRLSSFVLRRTGPGAAALLDPEAGSVEQLELEGLSNCTDVARFTDDPARAAVLCRGDAFGEDETRSGIAIVRVVDGHPTLEARFMPHLDASIPPPSNGLVALDGARLAYVSSGSFFEDRLDQLVVLDTRSASARVLAESSPTPFELGDGAFDGARGELLVPDGNDRSLRRFDASSGAELDAIPLTSSCLRLSPRQVTMLR